MHTQIFRSQQALLFRGDGGEIDVPGRRNFGCSIGARHLEQYAAAGAVVHGAIVDLVAGSGGVDAKMIVMGGVEDVAAWGWVCSRHHGDDVRLVVLSHLADDVRLEKHRELYCLESALAGRCDHLICVHARGSKELSGNVELYPTG